MKRRLMVFALATAIGLGNGFYSAHAEELTEFVTRRGDQLFVDDEPVRFVSWNIPNLLNIEDSFEFLGESPWRWPDEFEIADALESVRQMGGTVARSYVITVAREGSDMGENVHVLGPGKFNKRAFESLDLVLKVANEKQVRVILPLVDQWKWMGGIDQYAAFRGKEGKDFWTDRELIDDFKQTIHTIVNRRNTFTGKLYRDDPAIFAWETGNEIDAPPAWTAEIAAYLKLLDSNHLVIDGRSLKGVTVTSLADPNVDVITTHHYPGNGNIAEIITRNARQLAGKKPYLVGEFGFVPLDETVEVLEAVQQEAVVGALYWSLRYHRREGGFYWHDEPAGINLFKAYHWPGFDSGAAYHEREILAAMVRAAYGVRGKEPPPLAPPAAPTLLSIEHPSRISWQGSAGAEGYRMERRGSSANPWQTIADSISDAAVQYRPLYVDDTIELNHSYYYRVVAHNAGGESPPSNVVGPVTAAHHMLVDEMRADFPRRSVDGETALRSDKARRVQEDVHRLELKPAASVTYQLDRAPTSVRVFAFCETASGAPGVLVSNDDQQRHVVKTNNRSTARGAGDYGYLVPVLVEASIDDAAARYVHITNNTGESIQISRVELEY